MIYRVCDCTYSTERTETHRTPPVTSPFVKISFRYLRAGNLIPICVPTADPGLQSACKDAKEKEFFPLGINKVSHYEPILGPRISLNHRNDDGEGRESSTVSLPADKAQILPCSISIWYYPNTQCVINTPTFLWGVNKSRSIFSSGVTPKNQLWCIFRRCGRARPI